MKKPEIRNKLVKILFSLFCVVCVYQLIDIGGGVFYVAVIEIMTIKIIFPMSRQWLLIQYKIYRSLLLQKEIY